MSAVGGAVLQYWVYENWAAEPQITSASMG